MIRFHAIQANMIVGDIQGNKSKIIEYINKIEINDKYYSDTNLIVTSELAICGYTPQDMLLNDDFIRDCNIAIKDIAALVPEHIYLLIGHPTFTPNGGEGSKKLYNSASLISNGRIIRTFHKTLLPTYNIFDESRYFESNKSPEKNIFYLNGTPFGVTICEDIWNEGFSQGQEILYNIKPVEELVHNGAKFIINLSASPYELGKEVLRLQMIQEICKTYGIKMLYVNQVGANDSLVFDGRSCLVEPSGNYSIFAPFEEQAEEMSCVRPQIFGELNNLRSSLVLGIQDYFKKQGFKKAIIGMSGGVDSAVTVALAAEALGIENVIGVTMPSKFNIAETRKDAELQAQNMGIEFYEIPIEASKIAIQDTINICTGKSGFSKGITGENLQARIRGMILMAMSNDMDGAIVLTTGNKSEMSMGYFSIFGDSAGGLGPLGDVYKTQVFDLASYYCNEKSWIPKSVIVRPPSAELSEDQKDEDSLPPYSLLDKILKIVIDKDGNYTEKDLEIILNYSKNLFKTPEQISQAMKTVGDCKDPKKMIAFITKKVMRNEFKRRLAPPCIRVNNRPWNIGWRKPIVAKY